MQSNLLRINYDSQKMWKPKTSAWFISLELIMLMLVDSTPFGFETGGWFAFLSLLLSLPLTPLLSIPRAVKQHQPLSSLPISPYHPPYEGTWQVFKNGMHFPRKAKSPWCWIECQDPEHGEILVSSIHGILQHCSCRLTKILNEQIFRVEEWLCSACQN